MNLYEAAKKAVGVMANARDFLEEEQYKNPTEEWNVQQQADELHNTLQDLLAAVAEHKMTLDGLKVVDWLSKEKITVDPVTESLYRAIKYINELEAAVNVKQAPLTQKQIDKIMLETQITMNNFCDDEVQTEFARRIEAAHGIGEQT